MSEWQNKSDKEINVAVEKLTGMYCEDILGKHTPTCNYCNNPSDAWPIIDKTWAELNSKMTRSYTSKWQNQIDLNSGNKLRAAMIVYLEMNGVKP